MINRSILSWGITPDRLGEGMEGILQTAHIFVGRYKRLLPWRLPSINRSRVFVCHYLWLTIGILFIWKVIFELFWMADFQGNLHLPVPKLIDSPLPHCGICHVTCFSQWDNSKWQNQRLYKALEHSQFSSYCYAFTVTICLGQLVTGCDMWNGSSLPIVPVKAPDMWENSAKISSAA